MWVVLISSEPDLFTPSSNFPTFCLRTAESHTTKPWDQELSTMSQHRPGALYHLPFAMSYHFSVLLSVSSFQIKILQQRYIFLHSLRFAVSHKPWGTDYRIATKMKYIAVQRQKTASSLVTSLRHCFNFIMHTTELSTTHKLDYCIIVSADE